MNVEIIWNNFLETIKNELNTLSYDTWFKDTKLIEYSDGICKIEVPDFIHKKHLNITYRELINNTLNNIVGNNVNIELYTEDEINEKNNDTQTIIDNILSNDINIDNSYSTYNKTNLNKNYTFENFIVGKTNNFAQASSLEVAINPGRLYNPLFLYGNSGLGKTHLMHAIGNYIVNHSNLNVLYVTSDQFKQDFVGSYRKDENGNNFNNVKYFKEKYRNIDVLIVDDIQFFQGAQESQNEFFNIFNQLYNDNKQIILSSDRSPDDLNKLEDRLKTRFCWGLTADIHPPDFDLRVAILKKKIIGESIKKNIPDDVINYIASNIGNDVRHLESSITRLLAYSTIMGGIDITLNLAIDVLKDYINKGYSDNNKINKIQRVVAEYYQISVEDMKSKKRNAKLALPRQIAMYLCRKLTDESFPKIGIEFGGKDHSTVMHSVDKVEKEIQNNKELEKLIEKLKKDIE